MNNSTLIYSHDDVTIHQIADADSRRLDGFKALFEAQMPEYAFYFNRIVASIQHPYDSTTGQRHHVWLVAIADEPAGLAVTEYLPGRDLGLGMDFAIYPHFRSRHVEGLSLAAWIVRERLRQLARDGAAAGRTSIVPLAVEVGPRALLQRFQTYGLTPLPIFYHEPPDVSGKTNPRGLGDAESLLAVGYNPMQLGVYAPSMPLTSIRTTTASGRASCGRF